MRSIEWGRHQFTIRSACCVGRVCKRRSSTPVEGGGRRNSAATNPRNEISPDDQEYEGLDDLLEGIEVEAETEESKDAPTEVLESTSDRYVVDCFGFGSTLSFYNTVYSEVMQCVSASHLFIYTATAHPNT